MKELEMYVVEYYEANGDDPYYGDYHTAVYVELAKAEECAVSVSGRLYVGTIEDGEVVPGTLLKDYERR